MGDHTNYLTNKVLPIPLRQKTTHINTMLSWVKSQASEVSSALGRDLAEFADVVSKDTQFIIERIEGDASPELVSEIEQLENTLATYVEPIDVESAAYKRWLESSKYSLEAASSEIDTVLKTRTSVATYYDELVGDDLSEEDFWLRYFFRLQEVKERTAKRKLLDTIDQQQTQQSVEDEWGACMDTEHDVDAVRAMLAESRGECSTLKARVCKI